MNTNVYYKVVYHYINISFSIETYNKLLGRVFSKKYVENSIWTQMEYFIKYLQT